MSGTSLDGVDAALAKFTPSSTCEVIETFSVPFGNALRKELLALHECGLNELERTALVSNELARVYSQAVIGLIEKARVTNKQIEAIGCHGQTIRHRPELGFTLQIGNAALLAELSNMTVVSDFRSRDVAANGQGAPLVPAFHQAVFAHPKINRVLINIGGIANLSILHADKPVIGFDTGPGNMLMDAWAELHTGKRFDENGGWAMTGKVINELLANLLAQDFFKLAPPKSTGRDLFSLAWLQNYLKTEYAPQDVQRTLLAFTAQTIADTVTLYAPNTHEVYLCGGGAYNIALFECLQQLLAHTKIMTSDALGIKVDAVEAVAFAWLARQALLKEPGNLPAVTGADGPRVLGAIYAS